MADSRIAATSSDDPGKRSAPAKKPAPNVPGTAAFKGGFVEFFKDAWVEVTKKTTWPTRAELARSTTVVLAAVIAVSFYLAFWDFAMSQFTALVFKSR